MKLQKRFIYALVLFGVVVVFSLALAPSYSLAEEPVTITTYEPLADDIPYVYKENSVNERTIGTVVSGLFKLFFAVSIILTVLMVTMAGIQYLTSSAGGSKELAKTRIRNAFFGLGLALFSWVFLSTINTNLVSFSLDIESQIENLDSYNTILPKGESAFGYFYRVFDRNMAVPDTGELGTIIYYGYDYSYGDSARGFFRKDKCEEWSSNVSEPQNGYILRDGECSLINPPGQSGSWFFKYGYRDTDIIGYYGTEAKCISESVRFETQDEGEIIPAPGDKRCVQDATRVSNDANWSEGYYEVKIGPGTSREQSLTERVASVMSGPYTTLEICGENKTPNRRPGLTTQGNYTECLYADRVGVWYDTEEDARDNAPNDSSTYPSNPEERFQDIIRDEDRVQSLLREGSAEQITTNYSWNKCRNLGDTCTSVGLLPPNATTGLLKLAQVLSSGATTATHKLVITGGTEFWWHNTHGPGMPNVDLSTKGPGHTNVLIGLDKWIIENTPNKPSGLSDSEWSRYNTLRVGDLAVFRPPHFTVFVVENNVFWAPVQFRYERDPADHWHVMFPDFN